MVGALKLGSQRHFSYLCSILRNRCSTTYEGRWVWGLRTPFSDSIHWWRTTQPHWKSATFKFQQTHTRWTLLNAALCGTTNATQLYIQNDNREGQHNSVTCRTYASGRRNVVLMKHQYAHGTSEKWHSLAKNPNLHHWELKIDHRVDAAIRDSNLVHRTLIPGGGTSKVLGGALYLCPLQGN